LLAGWFSVTDASVAAARILVALFSALLLWSFYLLLHNTMTTFAAASATLLLLLIDKTLKSHRYALVYYRAYLVDF